MRKIIFMGQSGEQAVYYNTRTKEALVADKSDLLDTEGARRGTGSTEGSGCLIPLIFLLVLLVLMGSMVLIPVFSGFRYNSWMVPVYIFALLLVCFGFIWMMETALYKGVKQVRRATRQQFAEAVDTNLFWENFGTKKASIGKMFMFLIVILSAIFVTIIGVLTVPNILSSFVKEEKFDIQILLSILMGSLPGISYLLLFQNNPIRWFLAVRKYEQGKVIFTEEHDDIS